MPEDILRIDRGLDPHQPRQIIAPIRPGKTVAENLAGVKLHTDQDVIVPVSRAFEKSGGLHILRGNLAPEGSVIKSTSIDPTLIDPDQKYHHLGPAKVFTTEAAAIQAIKSGRIIENDVMVLICCGPAGAGMQEIYQITAALKALPFGKYVAVLTDARFSGVSTGACIGHISPEALAGGALGKLRDGDQIEITIDRKNLTGAVDFVGTLNGTMSPEVAIQFLDERGSRPDLAPHPDLPADTRLWAALVQASGGIWGGCVYDVDTITSLLNKAREPSESTAQSTTSTLSGKV